MNTNKNGKNVFLIRVHSWLLFLVCGRWVVLDHTPKFFGVACLLAGRSASKLAGYTKEFSNYTKEFSN
jgi:hypothetical protein